MIEIILPSIKNSPLAVEWSAKFDLTKTCLQTFDDPIMMNFFSLSSIPRCAQTFLDMRGVHFANRLNLTSCDTKHALT